MDFSHHCSPPPPGGASSPRPSHFELGHAGPVDGRDPAAMGPSSNGLFTWTSSELNEPRSWTSSRTDEKRACRTSIRTRDRSWYKARFLGSMMTCMTRLSWRCSGDISHDNIHEINTKCPIQTSLIGVIL